MKKTSIIFLLLLIIVIVNNSSADRLPSQGSEIQQFNINTMVDATGVFEDDTRIDWNIAKNGSPSDTSLGKGEIIASAMYSDTLLSNGGTITQNRNTGFDSSSQKSKMFNIESEKILTYTSKNAAILTGDERQVLMIDGNYSSDKTNETICTLELSDTLAYPAFSDAALTRGTLINMNNARVSTHSGLRNVGSSSTSAGVSYQIAVTPDNGNGNQYAVGTVKTEFIGSILEARDGKKSSSSKKSKSSSSSNDWKTPAATNDWKDATEVTGGIENLQKSYSYQSGMKL